MQISEGSEIFLISIYYLYMDELEIVYRRSQI